jgi:integrase
VARNIKKKILKSGELRYVVDFRHAGRRYRKFFATYDEADAHLSETKLKIYGNQFQGKPKPVTLLMFAREYLQNSKTMKSQATYTWVDRFRVGRFLTFIYARRTKRTLSLSIAAAMDFIVGMDPEGKPVSQGDLEFELFLRMTRLETLSCIEIEEYVSALKANGHPAATINGYLEVVRTSLNFALRRGYLSKNPAAQIRKVTPDRPLFKPLSKEGIIALLRACRADDARKEHRYRRTGHKYHLFELVATGLFAGLRKQELIHLDWDDVDFDHDMIWIRKKPGFQPKWHHERGVPIEPLLRQILEPVRRREGHCFPNGVGGMYSNNFLRDLKQAAENAKVEDLSIHDLRRNYASHLIMNGESHFHVMKWMGHKDAETLLLYAHLSPGTNRFKNPSVFVEKDITALMDAPPQTVSATVAKLVPMGASGGKEGAKLGG